MALSRSPSPGALPDPKIDPQPIESEEVERPTLDLDSEYSPSTPPEGSAAADGASEWHGDRQESKSVLYLILLTLSMGG